MLIFWWTGRGYLAFVVLLATMIAAGVLLSATEPRIPDGPIFWGPVLIVAAILIWFVGTRINRKALAKLQPATLRQRLLYRARNRFMSMPMETSALPLALIGLAIFIAALE